MSFIQIYFFEWIFWQSFSNFLENQRVSSNAHNFHNDFFCL